MNWFDLEYQYKLYLEGTGLDESKMLPVQKSETKRAFMAGCYQMLSTMIYKVSPLEDTKAAQTMTDMLRQAEEFFKKESIKDNPNIN